LIFNFKKVSLPDFPKSLFAGRDFGDEERLWGRRENAGKKTWDKYILGSLTSKTKRDFGERASRTKRDFGENIFADEERLRGTKRGR